METSGYTTAGGIRVEVATADVPETVLDDVVSTLGERRGGVLSSGMEYPGRYSRWHLAYVDPCLEIVARGRTVTARALNARGRVVLPAVASCLLAAGEPVSEPAADRVEVHVPESAEILPEEMRSRRPTVFTAIREVIAAFKGENEHLGLYGAFGYDLAFQFEPIRQVLTRAADQRDLVLHLPDRIMVIDRKRETSKEYRYEFTVDGVSTHGLPRDGESVPLPPAPAELPADPAKGAYAKVVAAAKEKFVRGDLFEVVPGQVFHAPCTDPAAFYRGLRKANPAPYEFLFNLGEGEHLVGASPEMYVRVSGDRVETCPISGTIARGGNPVEDAEAIRTLLSSVKEESELTMCTDVDRNDKSRICVPGSVQVIGRRQIEMYSRLIHTVDHIEGRLRPGFDALDAFLTHMWAVTVTGAPKTWAMQFIEDHEATTRRWYGGAVGYIGFDGSMNTGLTLRTAQIREGVATVRAGATLLFDSDPDAEERETELKASALLGALAAVAARTAEAGAAAPAPAAAQAPERPGEGMKVLLVDHEDSFVNTLADYFRQQGAEVVTLRHGFPAEMIDEIDPSLVVLSPGPGWPSDFGLPALVDALYARGLPVFGVCLGLQGMVEQAGGTLELLSYPEHGKRGQVKRMGGSALLDGLPEEFVAARYHSLHAKQPGVDGFTVTALTPDGAVMAIEDVARRRFAVQFHPESILTAEGGAGARIIANVLKLSRPVA
ncbi:anthranilate synthase component I [Planomonospora parontospora subsp. parontospora]|uniref:Anthranilate synthase n=2 Tax=Planomonospora parontospora TaxID=58119 RepID=A0AA37BK01_9ACTN|nr:anthranilate synthase component I [Planomonospora parontospora]GGK82623.1 anthranilate synthase component I [Planomonospora parontospora]GII12193.1 anthranilate synthase component I [Planomonospora parontospora subsp. parontospora]